MEPAPRASRSRASATAAASSLGTVLVEQSEQSNSVRAQGLTALGEALEERVGGGDGGAEAVAGGVCVGLAGGRKQPVEMRGVLDGQSGVVGAVMVGELGLPVQDAVVAPAGAPGCRVGDRRVGQPRDHPEDAQ